MATCLVLLAGRALGDGLEISELHRLEGNRVVLRHTSEATNYYVLLRGEEIDDLRPVGMAFGRDALLTLLDVGAPASKAYYAVEARSLDAPVDLDGDGINDVEELRRGTDPLRSGGVTNHPPVVDWAEPRPGGAVRLHAPVRLAADSSDPDGDAVRIEFFVDGSLIAAAVGSPTATEWIGGPVGIRRLIALGTDARGSSGVSDPIDILVTTTNLVPNVVLRALDPGADLVEPASVTLLAEANDADGWLIAVEFWADGKRFAVVPVPPFQVTWSDLPAGEHWVVARAVDNEGGRGQSAPVGIRVKLLTIDPPSGTERLSREIGLFNYGSRSARVEAVSRQLSVYNAEAGSGPPQSSVRQPLSRVVSLWNFGSPTADLEAVSRPVSLYNAAPGSGPPTTSVRQVLSPELSVWNFGGPTALVEGLAQEVSVFNFGGPTASREAVGREVSLLNEYELPPN